MFLTIDMQSDIPLYVQIRNQIIEGIATESLKPGDTLPSVRQMASDLGINLHTVNKVYTLLKQENFLTVHRKSGVVVNDPQYFKADDSYTERLKQDLRPALAEAFCRGVTEEDFVTHCRKIFSELQNHRGGKKL